MAVRCSKCGEELLGAVNRCWKCGHTFALRPEMDGRPPVRTGAVISGNVPLDAQVLDENVAQPGAVSTLPAVQPVIQPATAAVVVPQRLPGVNVVDARRAAMMAMGGTVASLVLGVFAAVLGLVWPPAAIIAVLGLGMGIWGLSSPKRNLALVGMLLCCLAIGIGAFGGVRAVYLQVQANKVPEIVP